MKGRTGAALMAGAAAIGGMGFYAASAGQGQKVTGPRAVYWIDADTESGLPLASGAPSMGDMMRMMGGGDMAKKRLHLRLASNEGPVATRFEAQHAPPATLDDGRVLKLAFERVAKTPGPSTPGSSDPTQGKARLVVYWGCGEHVGAGQPRVVDVSTTNVAAAKRAGALLNPAIVLDRQAPPLPGAWRSFAEWPTAKDRRDFPSRASLAGGHRVTAAFAPDIAFALDGRQDFLPPLAVTGNRVGAGGAVPLAWTALPRTGAVAVSAIGAGADGAAVFWANSLPAMRWATLAPDYLTGADIARLTADATLLRGDAPACTIPTEVVKALSGAGLFRINGYVADTNLSYPPRPADPKQPWPIEWTVKVRYRTAATGLIGQDISGAGSDDAAACTGPDCPPAPKKKKSGLLGRLRDVVKP